MDTQTIDLAVNKKFTDFETAIKAELGAKLNAHSDISDYKANMDNIAKLQTAYQEINDFSKED